MDTYPIRLHKPRYQIYEECYLCTREYWIQKSITIFGIHLWWKRIAYYPTRADAAKALTTLNS